MRNSGPLIGITASRNTAIIHRTRLGHAVIARLGAVILMPLPHVAFWGRLGAPRRGGLLRQSTGGATNSLAANRRKSCSTGTSAGHGAFIALTDRIDRIS